MTFPTANERGRLLSTQFFYGIGPYYYVGNGSTKYLTQF